MYRSRFLGQAILLASLFSESNVEDTGLHWDKQSLFENSTIKLTPIKLSKKQRKKLGLK
jgi:hypothetical protein